MATALYKGMLLGKSSEEVDHSQRVAMDRTSAIFYVIGSALALATLALPSWTGRETTELFVLWGLALVDGLFVWDKAGKIPVWFHHVNIVLLTFIISAGVYLNGAAGPAIASFYLAVAIYAFFFFGRWAALVHVVLIGAGYAAALSLLGGPLGLAEARWLMLFGMMLMTGGAVGWLVERIRALADMEHALKEESVQAREEADRANKAKSEFLSRMSHELRTPLNAVLGFAQVLEMDELDDDQSESVRQINKAGTHLLNLINEVLDLSRIEAGRLSMSIEPVRWHDALDECLTLMTPLAADRGITLHADLDGTSVEFLRADHQRLKQILLNLLSNAVKYNSEEGTIIVSAKEADAGLRISVTDTGDGIPADKINRLFNPFERLEADRTTIEGTGLGLALTKRLVEAMGGKIGVESELGVGSTFWIEFEATEGQDSAAGQQLQPAAPIELDTVEEGQDHRVLYIEDNLANLQLLQRLFADRPNIEMMSAMQGQLGVELAVEHKPDLILLDLNLPDIDGDEVLERLHQDDRTSSIPVVMITADATPGQARRLIQAGAFDYLTKPIDVTKFFRVVDHILEGVED
ncbi:MAG: ATP-binding response regulator [Actinomycetota bacterium]